MKRKDIAEFQQKTLAESRKLLIEARKNFLKLKMEMASGKIKDIHALAKAQDDLARMMTIIRQKELEDQK